MANRKRLLKEGVVKKAEINNHEVSKELADFFNKVLETLNKNKQILSGKWALLTR